MAMSSAWTQSPKLVRAAKCSRHSSGRLLAGRDADLRREVLDQHRHQVGREQDPQQQVAVLRAAGDVRGEVARVDVGDARDERRARGRRASPAGARACRRRCRSLSPGRATASAVARPAPAAESRAHLDAHGAGQRAAERVDVRRRSARTAGRRRAACRRPRRARPARCRAPRGSAASPGRSPRRARTRRARRRSSVVQRDGRRPSSMWSVRVGDRVAVRVVRRVAELGGDQLLELLGEDVLEHLGLGVHAVPGHAERLGQVELEQAVVAQDLERDPAPGLASARRRGRARGVTRPRPSSRLTIADAEPGVTPRRSASALVETRCRRAARARRSPWRSPRPRWWWCVMPRLIVMACLNLMCAMAARQVRIATRAGRVLPSGHGHVRDRRHHARRPLRARQARASTGPTPQGVPQRPGDQRRRGARARRGLLRRAADAQGQDARRPARAATPATSCCSTPSASRCRRSSTSLRRVLDRLRRRAAQAHARARAARRRSARRARALAGADDAAGGRARPPRRAARRRRRAPRRHRRAASTSCATPRTPSAVRERAAGGRRRARSTRTRPRSRASSRAPALRRRPRRHRHPPGGRAQRARRELHEGLLRRPGDRRAPALPGQAEPPPARAAARARRVPAGTPLRLGEREVGRLTSVVVSPRSGRSAWRSCAARPQPGDDARGRRRRRDRRGRRRCRSSRAAAGRAERAPPRRRARRGQPARRP